MNLGELLGFLLTVAWIADAYLRLRARRRSGDVSSFGHRALDNLHLLILGTLLAGVLAGLLFFLGGYRSHPIRERFIFYLAFLLVGAFLTWLCNWILRSRKPR